MKALRLFVLSIASIACACNSGDNRSSGENGFDSGSGDSDTDNDTGTSNNTGDTDSSTELDAGMPEDPLYQWHSYFSSPNSTYGKDIALDHEGNIIICGQSNGQLSGDDIEDPINYGEEQETMFVLKLNADGGCLWHTLFGVDQNDVANNVSIDSDGNILVVGSSKSPWNGPAGQNPIVPANEAQEAFVLKLDKNGIYQWHTFVGGSSADSGEGIAVDEMGNVVISGSSEAHWAGPNQEASLSPAQTNGESDNIFVAKLDKDGGYLWHTFYGTSTGDDSARDLFIDADGKIVVSGRSKSVWNGPAEEPPIDRGSGWTRLFILKLDENGTYQWHSFFSASVWGTHTYQVSGDQESNIYALAATEEHWKGPDGQYPLNNTSSHIKRDDMYVVKLDSNGNYQWHTFYLASFSKGIVHYPLNYYGNGLTTSPDGHVFFTGHVGESWYYKGITKPHSPYSGHYDLFVVALNSSGEYEWHTFYGTEEGPTEGDCLAIDNSGDLYVVGVDNYPWNGPDNQPPLYPFIEHQFGSNKHILVIKLATDIPSI